MSYTVNLGSNQITNCDAVLEIDGLEVFRLRERIGDGQLVVDFDIRDAANNRLATIAKSNVVHAAAGYIVKNLAKESRVEDASGKTVARVVEQSTGVISIEGEFWVNGKNVSITPLEAVIGGCTIRGSKISGFGKAISVSTNGFSIGCRK